MEQHAARPDCRTVTASAACGAATSTLPDLVTSGMSACLSLSDAFCTSAMDMTSQRSASPLPRSRCTVNYLQVLASTKQSARAGTVRVDDLSRQRTGLSKTRHGHCSRWNIKALQPLERRISMTNELCEHNAAKLGRLDCRRCASISTTLTALRLPQPA
jgi:hypothetical protein